MGVEAFKTTIQTAIEAHPPIADGSTAAYDFVDDFVEERGSGKHRQLVWDGNADQEIADVLYQTSWTLDLVLYLLRRNRTLQAFKAAVNNESADLRKLVDELGALGTDVLEAEVLPTTIDFGGMEDAQNAGGVQQNKLARIHFGFRVLTVE